MDKDYNPPFTNKVVIHTIDMQKYSLTSSRKDKTQTTLKEFLVFTHNLKQLRRKNVDNSINIPKIRNNT